MIDELIDKYMYEFIVTFDNLVISYLCEEDKKKVTELNKTRPITNKTREEVSKILEENYIKLLIVGNQYWICNGKGKKLIGLSREFPMIQYLIPKR